MRIEESVYFKSKEEERKWFEEEDNDEDEFIKDLLEYLRTEGTEFIKEIPFNEVWDAFWYVPKPHFFIEDSHKAAVIYAYNEETCQYIGGFFDVTRKRDIHLLHREHSIFKREGVVIRGGKVVRKFIKNTNKHCYPIFPRFNPRTHQRHQFIILGWDYYMDTSDVELIELDVPTLQDDYISSSEDSLPILGSRVLPQRVTVREIVEGGLQAELLP